MLTKITFEKRVNVILALAIVFLLVFATNRIDKEHFEVAQKSVKEVYTDRVLVQDYIFSISNLLFTKRIALKDSTIESAGSTKNKEISQLILDFRATKLTNGEVNYLNTLEEDFKVLKKFEIQQNEESEYVKVLVKMQETLQELSEIQTRESKDLTHTAQKSLDMNQLLSNLEIGFLIVTGIAIQFMIFYRVKKSSLKK